MNFKYTIISGALILSILPGSASAASSKSDLNNQINKLEQQVQEVNESKKGLKTELNNIQSEITNTNKKVKESQDKIKNMENNIASLTNEITVLNNYIIKKEKEILIKQKEIEEKKENLGHTISFLYENKDVSFVEYFFQSGDLDEILNSFEFIKTIASENDLVFKEVQHQEKELKKAKQNLETKKASIEEKLKETELLKRRLVEEKNVLDKLLAKQKQEESVIVDQLIQVETQANNAMASIIAATSQIEAIAKEEARQEEIKLKAIEEARQEEIKRKAAEEAIRVNNQVKKQPKTQTKEQSKEQPKNQAKEQVKTQPKEQPKLNTPNPTENKPKPTLNKIGLAYSSDLVTPMKKGTYTYTSDFGYRVHPIFKTKHLHSGMDLGAPSGTPIYAAGSGKVIYAGPAKGYGNLIVILHANDVYSLYAHSYAQNIYVKSGQNVSVGQHISDVGSAGNSTGPHLHFSIAEGKTASKYNFVNPLKYVSR